MITLKRTLLGALWTVVAVAILAGMAAAIRLNRMHRHTAVVNRVAQMYEVDPELISSVIWRESRFNAAAVGGVGEIGLMQVTEVVGWEWAAAANIEEFDRDDLFDPETNIHAGTWYLSRALRQWSDRDDPLPYALAQYNAGRSNALRWARDSGQDADQFIAEITYPGTQAYVRGILARYDRKTASRPGRR